MGNQFQSSVKSPLEAYFQNNPAPKMVPPVLSGAVDPELLKLKEAELRVRRGLPHLHGFKFYPWARKFFESQERKTFLCAANQISKSSTQIRKAIHWATEKSLWPILWPTSPLPNQYWYLYPTSEQATIEFETKWKQFLPKEEYKDHAVYGWKEQYKRDEIHAIHFNSGVSIYFKSYRKGLEALQTGTVYAAFLDEELPEDLWDELVFRGQAVGGYISMVFTATMGQEFWRKVMEPRGREEEIFPEAMKLQVSMYDCQQYEDGTPSHWTDQRINGAIASCKSTAEINRRVFGKFVKDEGLTYGMFDVKRHMKKAHHVPKRWPVYVGVDIGAGGTETKAHPSAIVVVAVRPDYQAARVIYTWRGDGQRTAASDVYRKYCEIMADLQVMPVCSAYDWASVEFGEIAIRNGAGFVRADKSHDRGEAFINVLFRNDMLEIYETAEAGKLAGELASVAIKGPKTEKKDDLCDALRYCVTQIPFDWSVLGVKVDVDTAPVKPQTKEEAEAADIAERRKVFDEKERETEELSEEIGYWNSLYEN